MKKTWIYLASIILIILIPLLSVIAYAYTIKDVYEISYARVLQVQYNYLKETKGESRIIIVGTSSSAFGFDVDAVAAIEKEFNKKVVIFGNYGAMGNTCFLKWVKDQVHEGDIVVYMYDIYKAALDVAFGGETTLQGIYKNLEMFNSLNDEQRMQVVAALPKYIRECIEYKVKESGFPEWFRRSAFDDRGIMTYYREENIMDEKYEPDGIIEVYADEISEDFTSYIKQWGEDLKAKGATAYFRYGPANELARSYYLNDIVMAEFDEAWSKAIGIKCVNSFKDTFMKWEYFFDGNHHLNSYGSQYLASSFIYDLEVAIYGYSEYQRVYPLGT